jgi:hypothetical protein
MRKAEDIFGVSSVDLDKKLSEFYDAAEEALKKHNPGIAAELPFHSRLPLHLIPFKERTALFKQYRDAIGLDDALNSLTSRPSGHPHNIGELVANGHRQGVERIYDALVTGMPANADNPFGRLPGTDMGGSRLSSIYSSLNIQFNKRVIQDRAGVTTLDSALPSSYFSIGTRSIPARSSMQLPQFGPNTLKGASTLVYDVETAGLAKGQIREVAYAINGVAQEPILFNPKEFQRGLVNVDGRAGNLVDFMRRKHGLKIPTSTTTGDEFAEGMRPFLEAITKTDYVVGHNIAGFDNEQVFVGLSRTNRYKTDSKFAALVDEAFEKVQTKTIDTLRIAREMPSLSGLHAADELAAMSQHTPYSIQNLLLKTDLVERMGGVEDFAKLMGDKGLHHATIDIAVTDAILKAGPDGLKVKDLGEGLSGEEASIAARVKAQILDSAAITPFTNLSGPSDITDDVLRHLIRNYTDDDSGLVARSGSELDALMRSGSAADQAEAFKRIRSSTPDLLSVKLTPVEQQILSERRLTPDMIGADGSLFGRLKAHQQMKQAANAAKAQSVATKAGLPFAGLSTDERTIAYGISRATSTLSEIGVGSNEARVAGLASDTLVSRFAMFGADDVDYMTRSGRVSLPGQLISASGVLKENDLVRLSVVEPTAHSTGAINVVKSLSDEQADALKTFLAELLEKDNKSIGEILGASDSGVAKFREAMADGLTERIDKRGVSVAQIYGNENNRAIQGVINVFKKYLNVDGMLEDRSMGSIALSVSDADFDSGILRTAGAFLNKGVGEEGRASLAESTTAARRLYQSTIDLAAANDPSLRVASAVDRLSGTMKADVVQGVYSKVQNHFIPNLGKGMVGLVAVGAGALLFRRRQENEKLNETFDFQGWESSGQGEYGVYQQIQAQQELGYDGYSNLVDPLATASLTNSLSLSRTGHHNYDWDRNNQIYGGLL